MSYVPKQTKSVTLTDQTIPMLVTCEDVTKPETVTLVDPSDLAASFGPRVSLKTVTLEITRELVTEGQVKGVLGWLEMVGRNQANPKGKPTNGRVSEQSSPEIYMIATSDFATDLYQ